MTMHQGMDLSRFQKVSSDQNTTTLRHKNGHEIKIAHSGLTPKMQEHINTLPAYMADGGEPMDPMSPAPVTDGSQPQPQPQQGIPPMPQTMPQAGQVDVVGQRPSMADELKAQDLAWQQDLHNGHIKPETYHELFAKKDTLGKIGTLFGMMISGAGSGLAHQTNAVTDMMDKTINNDLEAQKQSKVNAHNFIQLNQQHQLNVAQIDKMKKEGTLNDAQAKSMTAEANIKSYTLAKMQANRAALHHLIMQTNKLPVGSPQRAAAEQQLALLNQGIQSDNFDLADRAGAASALGNMSFGQPPAAPGAEANPEEGFQKQNQILRMSGNVPLADDREGRHFPGVEGQASIPLNGGDREQINSGISFQNELKRFTDWTKKHSGDISPSDKREGEALAAQLQGAYRQATHGGVYKEGEQGFISSVIDSEPTKFFNSIRVLPKLGAVQQESQAQLDQLLKSKGFKGYKGQKDANKYEGKTIVNSKGERQVMKDGKWVPVGQTSQATK